MVVCEKILNALDVWRAHYYDRYRLRPNVVMLGREDWRVLEKEADKVGGFTTPEKPKFRDMDIEVVDKDWHVSVGLRLIFAEDGFIYGAPDEDMESGWPLSERSD